jgi:hypothetical protein
LNNSIIITGMLLPFVVHTVMPFCGLPAASITFGGMKHLGIARITQERIVFANTPQD